MYSGTEIDLAATEGELFETLKALVGREGRLDAAGLTCDLKDAGQDCRTCVMAALDASDPRLRLCRVGKDERLVAERIETLARARTAATVELAASVGEWSEIGHLDADLAELLTEVGL